ncbi:MULTISPECIES: hypothetical protein [Enterobacteriaceae]|nr:hypothetical protein [Klebsiella pneumoniae]MCE1279334.1 hypothetical protein [Enterobacter hormaechei]QVJ82380.1 hypothetical protein JK004_23 [Cronobacter phage JK004]DAJ95926.1 MAG TPA: hypothetical protein [Caudoviricetes sp.]MCE1315820.1 hypothetical protein [Enterobacter hormaechei]MCJ7341729.1 hypothetical protein [Klebsiella pneumoniae]
MFAVKQEINNATSLFKIESITIGYPGTEVFDQAFEMADELGIKTPDAIEHIPVAYEDEEMTKPIGEEHTLSTERKNVQQEDCIAVLCSGIASEIFPDLPVMGGVGYQFLYKGDKVRIFNDALCIVEVE